MKYPIGIQSFEVIRTGSFHYVDKTALIYQLVNSGKVYFLSRPRRFGKSLLVDTLDCYFSGKRELFKGLAMEKLETAWEVHPVFHIDFNGIDFTVEGTLETKIESLIADWEDLYGKGKNEELIGDRFMGLLQRASEQTGHKAVVLIDEYDKPLLDVFDSGLMSERQHKLLEEEHRNMLKAFYSTLKSADKYLKFVLLTGVTKFSQVTVFSGLNNLKDISLDRRYEELCGISKQELVANFEQPIREFADFMQISYEKMLAELKRHYDGYHFGSRMVDMFNPFSVLNALDSQQIRDYWFATGTPTYLIRLMNHFKQDISDILSKKYAESAFMDYKADTERPLPMLFQSGYLTIKSYNQRQNNYRLDFPNEEVRAGLLPLLTANYLHTPSDDAGSWANDAAQYLEDGEIENFRTSLTAFLASIPYDSHESLKEEKLSEKHFQSTFYLILRLIGSFRISTQVEQCQAEGRVDCIVETADYVYIFELKHNATAEEALQQIEDKHYALSYAADKRKVICIGVNFSDKTRNIDGWVEAVYK